MELNKNGNFKQLFSVVNGIFCWTPYASLPITPTVYFALGKSSHKGVQTPPVVSLLRRAAKGN